MKLGKHIPKAHPKTLEFARYAVGGLPASAEKVYREYKTPDSAKKMFGNDSIGDCTCAGAANLLISATCHTGEVVIPSDADVIAMYSAISGYDPSTGNNDNGAAMTDALEYLRTTGLSGHKILAWAKIDHHNLEHRQLAVDLFGATYVGVELPQSAMDQFGKNQPWEIVLGSVIEGGHAIVHPGYGAEGGDYVTWAKWDQKASAAWESQYVDEEYVIITEDWINQATQKTPGGIDLATLQEDISQL